MKKMGHYHKGKFERYFYIYIYELHVTFFFPLQKYNNAITIHFSPIEVIYEEIMHNQKIEIFLLGKSLMTYYQY